MKQNARRRLLRPKYVIAAAITVALYLGCPFRLEVVRGESMNPTLRNGSLCLLDRGYYAHRPVERGDVIAFRMGDTVLTKRVYGAPGESIQVVRYPYDGTYGIPDPSLLPKLLRLAALRGAHRTEFTPYLTTLAIPADRCFVLGDNADESLDSRQFGMISTSDIIGKMVAPNGE